MTPADVIDSLPVEHQERFSELASEAPTAHIVLRDELQHYLVTVPQVGRLVGAIDLPMAERLAQECGELIDHASVHPHHTAVGHIAVQYFMVEDDDDDDVTGVLWFDEDIQVINAGCRALARPDVGTGLPQRQ